MLKSAKKAATSAIISGLALAMVATAAQAFEAPKYDRKIEAAAMAIVAKKIGEIRGSVAEDQWVAEQGVDEMITGPVAKVEPVAPPLVQFAALAVQAPVLNMTVSARPVRVVSSFVYF